MDIIISRLLTWLVHSHHTQLSSEYTINIFMWSHYPIVILMICWYVKTLQYFIEHIHLFESPEHVSMLLYTCSLITTRVQYLAPPFHKSLMLTPTVRYRWRDIYRNSRVFSILSKDVEVYDYSTMSPYLIPLHQLVFRPKRRRPELSVATSGQKASTDAARCYRVWRDISSTYRRRIHYPVHNIGAKRTPASSSSPFRHGFLCPHWYVREPSWYGWILGSYQISLNRSYKYVNIRFI